MHVPAFLWGRGSVFFFFIIPQRYGVSDVKENCYNYHQKCNLLQHLKDCSVQCGQYKQLYSDHTQYIPCRVHFIFMMATVLIELYFLNFEMRTSRLISTRNCLTCQCEFVEDIFSQIWMKYIGWVVSE